ncbi:MAG: hypothetical protein DRI34_09995 [Deltaproteobacteria bacterium]|nr:MAG: hypothetical protein DRI34_09995 [Deltaproteobacteria bacterium]
MNPGENKLSPAPTRRRAAAWCLLAMGVLLSGGLYHVLPSSRHQGHIWCERHNRFEHVHLSREDSAYWARQSAPLLARHQSEPEEHPACPHSWLQPVKLETASSPDGRQPLVAGNSTAFPVPPALPSRFLELAPKTSPPAA